MAASASPTAPKRRLHRIILLTALGLLTLWLLFFDSHSLLRRVQWHRDYARLSKENIRLQAEIDVLEAKLQEPLSDDVIEQIAREQYGMRRPGETVYRVEEKPE